MTTGFNNGAVKVDDAPTSRTNLGLGTGDSPTFGAVTVSALSAPYIINAYNLLDLASLGLLSRNAYTTIHSTLATLTIPTTATVGDIFTVVNNGAGGFKLAQSSGQQLRVGSSISTSGVTGFVSSTALGDSVTFMCTTANTVWIATSAIGNLTIV